MIKAVVDTNVFVYAIDRDSKYHHWSQSILNSNKYDLYTTSKNLSELLSVLSSSKGFNLSIKEAVAYVHKITKSIRILFPDHISLNEFFNICVKYSFKGVFVHDLEIAAITLSNDIDTIITKNAKDFKNIKGLQVVSL